MTQTMSFRYKKNFNDALVMLGIYVRQGVSDCLTAKVDMDKQTITFI
jgi:hypothetical protein